MEVVVLQYEPAWHKIHVVDAVYGVYAPVAHAVHTLLALVAVNVPGAQGSGVSDPLGHAYPG